MAVSHIRVRIGASLDSSVDAAFGSLRSKSRKAGQEVARELNRGMAAGAAGGAGSRVSPIEAQARRAAKAHAQAMRAIERGERDRAKTTEREAQRAAKADARAFSERLRSARQAAAEHERLERQKSRSSERAAREEIRNAQRVASAQARIRARSMDRFVTRTSHRASRFFWPNAPITQTARRVGMDILRGAGVETHLAGIVGNVVESEKLAKEISVQAYRPGETGAPGRRVNPGVLAGEARALGKAMASSTQEVLRGQKAFVDLQGDLEGARLVSTDLLRLAKGQGVAFEDMMYTAAKANAMFAEQPEYMHDTAKRAAAVYDLMKRLTYEGKVGSIVMDQMAKNFAKVSGMTGLFGGPRIQTAIQLTSLAQMAEAGAASNPRQAMTWINAFVRQLVKNREKIQRYTGVEVIGEGGLMKDPFTIIRQMMVATAGGGKAKLPGYKTEQNVTQAQLLMAGIGGRAQAFLGGLMKAQGVFVAASGGRSDPESIKAGLAAVNRDLLKFGETIGETQVVDDLKATLATTSSKAQIANQRIEALAERALVKAIPALEQLEGPAIKVGGALADIFTWAAQNPGEAIVVALAGATVRAAIESTFRASIEAAIYRGTGVIVTASGPAATGLTSVGTQAGFASTGLAGVAAKAGLAAGAVGALYLAAVQAAKLWNEIQGMRKGAEMEKPGSAAAEQRKKTEKEYRGAIATKAITSAGFQPGTVAPALGLANLFAEVEGERAAAEATGAGISNPTGPWRRFDARRTAVSTEDVLDKLDPRNWGPKGTEKPGEAIGTKVLDVRLQAIEGLLSRGIRITNPEDFRGPASGPGVDDGARDVQ